MAVLDLMVQRGWAVAYVLHPTGIKIRWTALGQKRMSGIWTALSELGLSEVRQDGLWAIRTLAITEFGESGPAIPPDHS